jgi:hypothetical protein
MKMKTKFFSFLLVFFFFIGVNHAQDYKSAIGAKLGYGLVGSYKTFLSESAAVDLFGGIRFGGGLALGAYYLKHKPIAAVDRLKWYWGFGGSYTTWTYGLSNNYYELGASGVLGLDYSFDDLPLNLSVDWAPTFVILDSYDYGGNYDRFRGGYGAFTARYILNK